MANTDTETSPRNGSGTPTSRDGSVTPTPSECSSFSDVQERPTKRRAVAGGATKTRREKKEKPRRRRRKNKGFILDEAEVDDADEDEDYSEEGFNDLIDNGSEEEGSSVQDIEGSTRGIYQWQQRNEEDFAEYLEKKYAEKSQVSTARLCDDEEEELVESSKAGRLLSDREQRDYEEYLQQRYGNKPVGVESLSEDSDQEINEDVKQHGRLPALKEPNLWMVKCRIGQEKAVCLNLMRKFLTHQNTDKELKINSIVAPDSVKGYIYVEAYAQPQVEDLVRQVADLKIGLHSIQQVPSSEMHEVLRVNRDRPPVRKNQWVRPKRGLYKDDIALVHFVDVTQNQMELKLLPRIDYSLPDRGADKSFTAKVRPRAKRFDPEAVKAINGEVHVEGSFWRYKSNRYSRQGFLYKKFIFSAVQIEGVKPTLAELELFSNYDGAINIQVPSTVVAPHIGHTFSCNDKVEVIKGELKGVLGKITNVSGNIISVMPNANQSQLLPIIIQADKLKKWFKTGDHVRVMTGRHKDQSGLIVRVGASSVVIAADNSNEELEVYPNDLRLCSAIAKAIGSTAKFKCGDIIQINSRQVGVVVRLEKDHVYVLDMNDNVVKCKPIQLHKFSGLFKAAGLDVDSNQIRNRDLVKVIAGCHVGRSGEIKQLYRYCAFLYNRHYNTNAGMFVCKMKDIRLQTRKPLYNRIANTSIDSSGKRSPQRSTGGSKNRPGPPYNMRNKQLLNKEVIITNGLYKGWVGIATTVTDEIVRVELQNALRTISVTRKDITLKTELDALKDRSFDKPPFTGNTTPPYRPDKPEGNESPRPLSYTSFYTPSYYKRQNRMSSMSSINSSLASCGYNLAARNPSLSTAISTATSGTYRSGLLPTPSSYSEIYSPGGYNSPLSASPSSINSYKTPTFSDHRSTFRLQQNISSIDENRSLFPKPSSYRCANTEISSPSTYYSPLSPSPSMNECKSPVFPSSNSQPSDDRYASRLEVETPSTPSFYGCVNAESSSLGGNDSMLSAPSP